MVGDGGSVTLGQPYLVEMEKVVSFILELSTLFQLFFSPIPCLKTRNPQVELYYEILDLLLLFSFIIFWKEIKNNVGNSPLKFSLLKIAKLPLANSHLQSSM